MSTSNSDKKEIVVDSSLEVFLEENFDNLNQKHNFKDKELKYEKKIIDNDIKYIIYVDWQAKFLIEEKDFEWFKDELTILWNIELTELQLDILKEEIENKSNSAFELIKSNTKLYTKYITIYKSKWAQNDLEAETKLKELSEKIEKPILWFLKTMLETFPTEVINSMSTWIQLALMETLVETEDSDNFFESFGKINPESWKDSFIKLFSLLSKWWNFQKLAQKVQNAISYIDTNENVLKNPSESVLLTNSYLFKEFVTNKKFEKSPTISISQLIFTVDEVDYTLETKWNSALSEQQNQKIQELLNSMKPKITEEFIENMEKEWWYLDKASQFIENRWKYQAWAVEIMEAIEWQLESIPFVWKLISIDSAWERLWKHKIIWWIVNLILRFMWFNEGFVWLEKKYQQKKLTDFLDNISEDSFVKSVFTQYQNEIYQKEKNLWENEKLITNEDPWSTWTQIDTSNLEWTWVKEKIPADFEVLKKSFIENIGEHKIHPSVAEMWNLSNYVNEETMQINKSSISNFMDEYIKTAIPHIASKLDRKQNNLSTDDFLFALIGFLKAWAHFIRWMQLWVVNKSTYQILIDQEPDNTEEEETTDETTSEDNNTENKTTYTDPDLEKIKNIDKNTNFLQDQDFLNYLLSLDWEFELPSGTMKNICKTESNWKLYTDSKLTESKSWALWLFQFLPDTAYQMMLSLQTSGKNNYWLTKTLEEFKNIKNNDEKKEILKPFLEDPVASARASAMYLSSFDKKDWENPDLIQKLSRYNRWPWNTDTVLPKWNLTAEIFCQKSWENFKIPEETQSYILKIIYWILKESGAKNPLEDWIFTNKPQFKNIQTLISSSNIETIKTKIQTAFDLVNNIKKPEKITILNEELQKKEIIATAENLWWFWTSIMVWFKWETFTNMSWAEESSNITDLTQDKINNLNPNTTPSLLIHFGWNTDVEKKPEEMSKLVEERVLRLLKKWIQPVLSTYLPRLVKDISQIKVPRIAQNTQETFKKRTEELKKQNDNIKLFNEEYRKLATKYNIPIVDLEKEIQLEENDYEKDFIHLTAQWYTKISNYIGSILPWSSIL